MAVIKIFVKDDCPKCPPAKLLADKLKHQKKRIELYNTDNASGLAEATFYGVMATPSVIIEGDDENVIAAWRGSVPSMKEVADAIQAAG